VILQVFAALLILQGATSESRAETVSPPANDSALKIEQWRENRNTTRPYLKFDAGFMFSSLLVERGALIWPKPIFMPAASLSIGEHWQVTRGLRYSDRWENFEFNASIKGSDDNPPLFSFSDRKKTFRNQREGTWSSDGQVTIKFPHNIRLQFLLEKDLDEHWGCSGWAQFTIGVLPFTSVGYGLGAGDKASSRYFYGPSAQGGITYNEYILQTFFPFLPFKGLLILRYAYSEILKKENQHAEYIRSDDKNHVLFFTALWPMN
jgi:hypothetical protein